MNLLEAFESVEAPAGTVPPERVGTAWGLISARCRRWSETPHEAHLREEAVAETLCKLVHLVKLQDGPLARIRRERGGDKTDVGHVERYLLTMLTNRLRDSLRRRTREHRVDPSHAETLPMPPDSAPSHGLELDEANRTQFRELCARGLAARLETMPKRYHENARAAWDDYWSVRFEERPFQELVAAERAACGEGVAPKTIENRIYKRHERAREHVADGLALLEAEMARDERGAVERVRAWLSSDAASCQIPEPDASEGKGTR